MFQSITAQLDNRQHAQHIRCAVCILIAIAKKRAASWSQMRKITVLNLSFMQIA